MPSATFNNIPLGDPADGVLDLRPGNIQRTIIVDQPLGLDGAITRHRGGGLQTITLRAWHRCASTAERLAYLETLMASLGSHHATLTYRDPQGTKTWPNCLAASAREERTDGPYIEFTLTFVRSAF